MIFISTDYVLSERSPTFCTNVYEFPVNQYGLQKLIAEQFVKEAYKDKPNDYMILRSSWMFGNSENSFVEKFLKNVFATYAAEIGKNDEKSKVEVAVADDAFGCPTPVWFIADTIESLILDGSHGTLDLRYPCSQISRYEWATMIWHAFVDTRLGIDPETNRVVDALRDSIEIVPRHSKDIGIQMHHPGKVDSIASSDLLAKDIIASDTIRYVTGNWHKYLNLVNEMIANRV